MTEAKGSPKPRTNVWRRGLAWGAGIVLGLAIVLAGGVYWAIGRTFDLPQWAEDRLQQRLALAVPQVKISFDELVIVVDEDWVPRIRLRNIGVKSPDGVDIARFHELKARFALQPLLSGQVHPKSLAVSGMVVGLRRDRAGMMSLSTDLLGQAAVREAQSLPQLISQFDAVLDMPTLQALQAIELRALTLQYDDLRAGRTWTLDGGRLLMTRQGEEVTMTADLALLSGGSGVATLSAQYTSTIGTVASDFGLSFSGIAAEDIASQNPAFALLDVLQAPISGGVESGMLADGTFRPLTARLEIGKGVLQPTAAVEPVPFDGMSAAFSYAPEAQLLRLDHLTVDSAWVSGRAEGAAELNLGTDGRRLLDALTAQLRVTELSANPNALYAEPVALSGVDVDVRVSLDPLRIDIGQVQIHDQGQVVTAEGHVQAGQAGWELALDAHMDGIAPPRLLALWPESLATRTRTWLDLNLLAADLRNVEFFIRRAPQQPPATYLGFEFDKTTVKVARFMPPVTRGRGRFSLLQRRMVVALDAGVVPVEQGGEVALDGSSFIIPDTGVKGGAPGILRLRSRSTITGALALLNGDPLNVADKANLAVDVAAGDAVIAGTVAFPLTKDRPPGSTRFDISGTLFDVASDALIPNRSLASDRLAIDVNNDSVTLAGPATVDAVPFNGSFQQPIGRGEPTQATLRGAVALSAQSLETFDITLPPGTVSGAGSGQLALKVGGGQTPTFDLTSDLVGVELNVPQINWRKPAGAEGRLAVAGNLGPTPQVDRLEIEGAGLSARGDVRLKAGGALDRVRFDQLRVGDWLDAAVSLTGTGPGNPVDVALLGGTLDLRAADLGGEADPAPAPDRPSAPLRVALDKLQITDTIALTNLEGLFATQAGLDGTFEARLNGDTPVAGRVVPQNGRSAVQLTSDDAGGVLRAAGLLRQIEDGALTLTLLPVGSDGTFDGQLRISDVTVRSASGIAALVNAISVVGLVNELNGDGIFFDDVEARFRLTPRRLTLTEASAVGSSLGLSMDGVYALDQGVIDMQGVISPVYLINSIGSVLTRRGEGLIGFNYTLRGPVAAPVVAVNPLSVLTPGMFREIFRAPAPQVPADPNQPQASVPPQKRVEPAYEGR